jgi:hypothetical protein
MAEELPEREQPNEMTVCLVEKGGAVGDHIMSRAVLWGRWCGR